MTAGAPRLFTELCQRAVRDRPRTLSSGKAAGYARAPQITLRIDGEISQNMGPVMVRFSADHAAVAPWLVENRRLPFAHAVETDAGPGRLGRDGGGNRSLLSANQYIASFPITNLPSPSMAPPPQTLAQKNP